ncbi:L,D-transpeptidase family protein [Ciceribacter sp. L1K22]|nr:L,D-transpeptidase family protein [Ciceribacter sp. L1K22]
MTLPKFKTPFVWASALSISLIASTALVADAHATTLMDLLRGGPGKSTERNAEKRPTLFGGSSSAAAPMLDGDPEPLPKVSGPRYYTYKTEAQRPIKIALPAVSAPAATDTDVTTGSVAPVSDVRAALAETKVLATDDVAKAVEAYYASGKPLIWVEGDAVTEKAKSAMSALAAAGDVGLDASDYLVSPPEATLAATDIDAQRRALARFELMLSAKVVAYVQDTVRGRIDPNKLSGYHDFKRKPVNLGPVLNMLRLSPDVAAYLRNRDPSSPQFAALKGELAKLRAEEASAGPSIVIASGTLLKPGNTSPELRNVVAALRKNGSEAMKATHAATLSAYVDGQDYTPELVAAVEDFQKEAGLKPDGVIGPATIRALVGHSNAEKISKLVIAMEQLRWLPADLGSRYVFINQPAYRVYYVNDGREQLSMRVVVGSRANQTYFFQDKIETVEVNPYWGVPQSIIVNEMLPKLRQDPTYLDRLGYEVSYKGRTVASSQVDWNSTHSVDVRQPPGGGNALGELKILFPNSHAIYMHDTPQKSFFQRDVRALSHGCVRLAEPRVMAAAVLGTSVEDVGREIAQGRNKAIPVKGDIPVYVSYFTAWPNKDGQVEFFDDVYGRDEHTMKAFEATTKARGAQG